MRMPNKRKKILFLEQYVKLSGGQQVLLSLIKGLKEHYEIHVVLPEKGELTEELGHLKIGYTVFPMGYYTLGRKTVSDILRYLLRLPYLIQNLKKLIREKDTDLVYANGARTFVWGTIACNLTKTPIIWHVHSIFSKGLSRKLCIYFGKNPSVKKIIAVSRAVKEPLIRLAKKTEVIYNAVDTRIYFPGKEKSRTDPLIGMVGFIMEWKGIDDLIRAAKIILSNHPMAKFIIVGDVLYDKKDRSYKKYLMKLVDNLKLNNSVIFTGYRKDIPEVMRALDIFILASRKPDPCPTSLIQAMASGTAVIATDFGGPAEIIKDSEDGLLYPPGNHTELAKKILFLLDNPVTRNAMASKASQKIKEAFNETGYLNRIKEIIRSSILK
jgi:glycosyltransferase involved in cell wall biosynthesis